MIPYGRQDVTQADIDAVVAVLRSDFLTQGPAVPRFEEAIADYCAARHAVAVNSATSALHLACAALGLGPGDWLWTSPITFVASANCALYCGARVDFVDIDPCSYNMCPNALEEKLQRAEKLGRLPKILVPVHLCGQPSDMAAIHTLSQRFGFRIIEDASHAIGARYGDEPVGCGRFSDVSVLSFHPVKIITSAEGGMALTNDKELADRMRLLRSHGITRDPESMDGEPHGPWYYQQLELGFNYRLSDLHAALGLSQATRIDQYVERRRRLAHRYGEMLAGLPVTLPWQHPRGQSSWHLYVVRLQLEHTARTQRQVFEAMRGMGVGVNLHYIPVHTHPFFRKLGFSAGQFPQSEAYYSEAVSLPLFPTMEDSSQDLVVQALREALRS